MCCFLPRLLTSIKIYIDKLLYNNLRIRLYLQIYLGLQKYFLDMDTHLLHILNNRRILLTITAGTQISDVIVKVSRRERILRHLSLGRPSFIFSRSVSFHIGARASVRVSSHS